jgi:hypothetical protein
LSIIISAKFATEYLYPPIGIVTSNALRPVTPSI